MVLDDSKILEFQGFVNTLDRMHIHGVKRRYWLKIYNNDPHKAAKLFYMKLDREFSNERTWGIAKAMLLRKYPHFAEDPEPEPEPEPIKDLSYFLRINGGRWGDCMFDVEEHNLKYPLPCKEHIL